MPVPGGPAMMTLGMLPSRAMTRSRLTVSSFPTTSFISFGRYFSIHGRSIALLVLARGGGAAAAAAAGSSTSISPDEAAVVA